MTFTNLVLNNTQNHSQQKRVKGSELMYVCICNGYTDKQIKSTVRQGGVQDAEETYQALGNGFCCGACRDCAEKIVADELPNQTLMAAE